MGFQDRILQRRSEDNALLGRNSTMYSANENDAAETKSKFFGIENNRAFPSCLDLRLAEGKAKALPYSFITEINYDASDGIEIITTSKRISITGRNLHLLYSFLTIFRVKYIQVNIGNDLTDEKELFVRAIEIEEI